MKRIAAAVAVALAMGLTAVPAQAHHGHDNGGGKSHHHFWVVGGTVVSQSLAKNDDGTYSGDVVIATRHWNRHERHSSDMSTGDQTQQRTFTLDHAKVRFHVSDTGDGTIDEHDVVAGDRVLLAGKSDRSRRRCDHNGDTTSAGTTAVRWAAFADPKSETTKRR